jgi:hypothetical protein
MADRQPEGRPRDGRPSDSDALLDGQPLVGPADAFFAELGGSVI